MQLDGLLDRLSNFHATTYPVISLYLDGRPDQQGRETYGVFVRKALAAKIRRWPERSPERESFHRDVDRILAWLHETARPSADGFAIFACAGAHDFFEAVQLDVPVTRHELFVEATPRLFPLACLAYRHRRHAVVVVDRHTARIFIFGLGETEAVDEIAGEKTRRSGAGGWSQARFQRHVDNFTLQHAKEVVDALDDAVRAEALDRVVLAGEPEVVSLVRDHLSKHVAERVVDVAGLDTHAGEAEIRERTLAALRTADARGDAETVARVLDAQRAGGFGAAGMDEVFAALVNGQVHELLISTTPDLIPGVGGRSSAEIADELVTMARRTSARLIVIEDGSLLAPVGGVAARLRYRIGGKAA
jgi:peptide chain release factor subunit 1